MQWQNASRERAVKRNILLKLCNRLFLMERKAWVSSVSVSPLRDVVVFKKKKKKKKKRKIALIQAKRIIATPFLRSILLVEEFANASYVAW
jgi:hypothetical protein